MNGLALCAGVGGLELGLSIACPGYRAVCVVEGEVYSAATLARRMEDGFLEPAPIYSDVRTFDGRPWRGVVDIISAGYPCQPFSTAGLGKGVDDPRHLWPEIARIVAETAPPLVFCENVPPHLSIGFDQVAADMGAMGYRLAAGVFSAWAVGAPHLRERLFWLALADSGGDELRDIAERGERTSQAAEQGDSEPGDDGAAELLADARGDEHELAARHLVRKRAETRGEWCEQASTPVDSSEGIPGGPAASDSTEDKGSDSGAMADPDGEQVEWSTVARQECNPWTVEPDVGRVADGVAHRVDRLRAIGNGVVPAVAARAFVTLLGELI